MEEENNGVTDKKTPEAEKRELKGFVFRRIGVGVLLAFAALWIFGTVLGMFNKGEPTRATRVQPTEHGTTDAHAPAHPAATAHDATTADHGTTGTDHATADEGHGDTASAGHEKAPAPSDGAAEDTAHGAAAGHAPGMQATPADAHGTESPADAHVTAAPADAHSPAAGHGDVDSEPVVHGPKGMAFINATMQPMDNELNERFWGWRPNDILDFTDNVNNFQLGVLEVTRRTAVALAERISRTGSTAAFDKNLETAMNWFMIKADRYWFPSPESKYKDGLDELRTYRERLIRGEAKFYTRTDNLIPLLMAFEDLLGSCDDNLVKAKEDDGSPVSHFKADDYFFYAKGVASAMYTILKAVHHDFETVIESRRGGEVLHHAIESCHHAMEIDPIYITNSGLSGILANHRANMAAPISHARFYVGVLIKTLST